MIPGVASLAMAAPIGNSTNRSWSMEVQYPPVVMLAVRMK